MKYKFPSEIKANLFISLIKAQMYDEYRKKSKCLSVEFAKINLRINLVSPGFTKTSYFKNFKKNNKLYNWTKSKIPIQRWASAKEISNLVNFLISDKSSYIMGQEIFIDGGWTIK